MCLSYKIISKQTEKLLLEKIDKLEKMIEELKARPAVVVQSVPTYIQSTPYIPPFTDPYCPDIVTCGIGTQSNTNLPSINGPIQLY